MHLVFKRHLTHCMCANISCLKKKQEKWFLCFRKHLRSKSYSSVKYAWMPFIGLFLLSFEPYWPCKRFSPRKFTHCNKTIGNHFPSLTVTIGLSTGFLIYQKATEIEFRKSMVYHKKMCHFSGFSSLDQKKRPRGLYIWKSAFAAFYGRPTFGPLCFVDGFLLSQKPIPLALLLPRQIPIKQLFEKWGQYICFGVPGLAGDYTQVIGGSPNYCHTPRQSSALGFRKQLLAWR